MNYRSWLIPVRISLVFLFLVLSFVLAPTTQALTTTKESCPLVNWVNADSRLIVMDDVNIINEIKMGQAQHLPQKTLQQNISLQISSRNRDIQRYQQDELQHPEDLSFSMVFVSSIDISSPRVTTKTVQVLQDEANRLVEDL